MQTTESSDPISVASTTNQIPQTPATMMVVSTIGRKRRYPGTKTGDAYRVEKRKK
jgi:hypothetical protein